MVANRLPILSYAPSLSLILRYRKSILFPSKPNPGISTYRVIRSLKINGSRPAKSRKALVKCTVMKWKIREDAPCGILFIGPLHFGMTRAQLRSVLSSPSESGTGSLGLTYDKYDEKKAIVYYDEDGRFQSIVFLPDAEVLLRHQSLFALTYEQLHHFIKSLYLTTKIRGTTLLLGENHYGLTPLLPKRPSLEAARCLRFDAPFVDRSWDALEKEMARIVASSTREWNISYQDSEVKFGPLSFSSSRDHVQSLLGDPLSTEGSTVVFPEGVRVSFSADNLLQDISFPFGTNVTLDTLPLFSLPFVDVLPLLTLNDPGLFNWKDMRVAPNALGWLRDIPEGDLLRTPLPRITFSSGNLRTKSNHILLDSTFAGPRPVWKVVPRGGLGGRLKVGPISIGMPRSTVKWALGVPDSIVAYSTYSTRETYSQQGVSLYYDDDGFVSAIALMPASQAKWDEYTLFPITDMESFLISKGFTKNEFGKFTAHGFSVTFNSSRVDFITEAAGNSALYSETYPISHGMTREEVRSLLGEGFKEYLPAIEILGSAADIFEEHNLMIFYNEKGQVAAIVFERPLLTTGPSSIFVLGQQPFEWSYDDLQYQLMPTLAPLLESQHLQLSALPSHDLGRGAPTHIRLDKGISESLREKLDQEMPRLRRRGKRAFEITLEDDLIFGPLRFGMMREEVHSVLLNPIRISENQEKFENDYVTVTYTDSDRLDGITFHFPSDVTLLGRQLFDLTYDQVAEIVMEFDDEATRYPNVGLLGKNKLRIDLPHVNGRSGNRAPYISFSSATLYARLLEEVIPRRTKVLGFPKLSRANWRVEPSGTSDGMPKIGPLEFGMTFEDVKMFLGTELELQGLLVVTYVWYPEYKVWLEFREESGLTVIAFPQAARELTYNGDCLFDMRPEELRECIGGISSDLMNHLVGWVEEYQDGLRISFRLDTAKDHPEQQVQ